MKRFFARLLTCLPLLVLAACETPTQPELPVPPTAHATLATPSTTEALQGLVYLYKAGIQLHEYGLLDDPQAYAFLDPVVRAYQHIEAARLVEAREALHQFIQVVQWLSSSGRLPQQVCTSLTDLATMIATTGGASAGPLPLFSDDFESYSASSKVSGGSNGFSWIDPRSDAAAGDYVRVSRDIAHSGGKSLKFHFTGGPAGDDAWAEQRFRFGRDLTELWLEFWVYFPDGSEGLGARYHPRENMNNKFVAIWGGDESGYSRAARATNEIWGTTGVYNVFMGNQQGRLGNTDFLNTGLRGRWIRYRQQLRVADRNRNNGIVRIWIDEVQTTNVTQAPLYANTTGDPNHFSMGYLLGWSNTGFNADTNVYIDDVKLYHANPGW